MSREAINQKKWIKNLLISQTSTKHNNRFKFSILFKNHPFIYTARRRIEMIDATILRKAQCLNKFQSFRCFGPFYDIRHWPELECLCQRVLKIGLSKLLSTSAPETAAIRNAEVISMPWWNRSASNKIEATDR